MWYFWLRQMNICVCRACYNDTDSKDTIKATRTTTVLIFTSVILALTGYRQAFTVIKAAIVDIFILTMDQISTCK